LTAGGRAHGVPRTRARRVLVVAVTALVVLALDQTTKSLAVAHLADGPRHLVGPLSLELAYNSGVAFSIGTGLTLPIVLVGLVIVLLIVWSARGAPSYPAAAGAGMVLGGALGNLGDRLFRGHGGAVVDFVHTSFWPTFNLADASIVCGCAVVGVVFWRRGGHAADRRPAGADDVGRAGPRGTAAEDGGSGDTGSVR